MLPFFNKGKGDKKDKKILEVLENRFLEDIYLQQHNIHVEVENGIVTLAGAVTSPLVRDLAEKVASQVEGVVEVHNNLDLGIGKAGEDVTEVNVSSSDVQLSEEANTGEANLNHPTSTRFTEVQSQTREDVTGGIDTGITADEAAQMAIPQTGEGSSVMDAGAVDAIKESGEEQSEDFLEAALTKGMHVVDREGQSVGKVKEVRRTDFLLSRFLARDVYVPYIFCKYDGEQVVLNVLASEIKDQGWASPAPF